MNLFILVWNYLRSRPLNTALNIFLLSLGIAVITLLLVFNNQLQTKITGNSRGIDLVVGAKGSPMQLILCNIFHIDFPTGNIKLVEAERISRNRLVKNAIPLALGDSYAGFRIIGTSNAYATLYKAELAQGEWWSNEMEVTLGSYVAEKLALNAGDKFTSTHGLTTDGQDHEEGFFVVSGIMARTNSVIDNLILTSIESVWKVHDMHAADSLAGEETLTTPSRLVPTVSATDSTKEITAMLIQYRTAMGAIQMPRWVNGQSSLQAASPAFETARLFAILGIGVDILKGFAYVLIGISGLSIFIALYNSLKERNYDMAIMRTMGAGRGILVVSILLEGTVLTVIGCVLGMLMGHAALMAMASWMGEAQKVGITGFVFYAEEWIILVGSLFLGLVCALIPAIQAYRTDISRVLAANG